MLVVDPAIANLIRENKTYRITSAIQTGAKMGMQLLDDDMFKLWQKGVVEKHDVIMKANMATTTWPTELPRPSGECFEEQG